MEWTLKARVGILIEIILFIIIFLSLFLQGAVADLYWYPVSILIIIAFALSLWAWEAGWLYSPKMTGLEPYLFLWIGLIIISGLASSHRWISILALERFIISLLFFYLMLWHFPSRTEEKVMLWFLFSVPVLISLLGLTAYFLKQPSFWVFPDNLSIVRGTFINHNNFAGLIILCFFLGAGLIMSLRTKGKEPKGELLAKRLILSIPLLILLLSLSLSLSRGGWLSFFLTTLSFFLWLGFRAQERRTRSYLIMILALIFFGITLALILEKNALRARAKTINDFFKDPSTGLDLNGRKMLWQNSLDMIKDYPWLGIGLGAFQPAFPHYRRPGQLYGESHAHNDLLQLAAETGVPATIVFLILLYKAFSLWWKKYSEEMDRFERRVSIGIIFGISGFLFHDLFDFHFHIPGLSYYFLALSAFLLKPRAREDSG